MLFRSGGAGDGDVREVVELGDGEGFHDVSGGYDVLGRGGRGREGRCGGGRGHGWHGLLAADEEMRDETDFDVLAVDGHGNK